MTFNNEHIKQEPCSPSSETISTQLLAGSTMYHHGARAAPAYNPIPQSFHPYYSAMAAGQYSSGSDSQAATPSPKAALKKTILSRRRANGQDELDNLFEEEKQYPLTKADIERRERRREQNRRAAKRCRNKKKNLQSKVSQETEELVQQNRRLAADNARLEQEVLFLRAVIDDHLRSGCCNLQRQTPQYENQRPASAHVDTEISSAISCAHVTLNTDSIAAKGEESAPSVNTQLNHSGFDQIRNFSGAEPTKNLDSLNLSSIDFNNIVSDLTSDMQNPLYLALMQEGAQQPNFLHHAAAQHAELTSLGQCVDPNLVQQNVVSTRQLPHAAPADRLSESSSAPRSHLGEHCPTTTTHPSVCQVEYGGNALMQQRLCIMEQYPDGYYVCDGYNEQPVELQYYSSSQN